MKEKSTYEIIGEETDYLGFYRVRLRRNDGKEVKVQARRVTELRRQNRITGAILYLKDLRKKKGIGGNGHE